MAITDYVEQGGGSFCSIAELTADITPGDTSLLIKNLRLITPDNRVVGMGVMIDNEIVRLASWDDVAGTIGVERGCADTVPAPHDEDALVWFFDANVGTNGVKYGGDGVVAVKVRPATASSAPIDPLKVLPVQVFLNMRFGCPYPPGQVLANGDPWWDGSKLISDIETTLTITWAHRDRVLQADQLIPHTEGSIGPEPGTTYQLDVVNDGDIVAHSYTGITGTSHDYTLAQAASDLGLVSPEVATGKLRLYAVRDGLLSLQFYEIGIHVSYTGAQGWGTAFGYGWGL